VSGRALPVQSNSICVQLGIAPFCVQVSPPPLLLPLPPEHDIRAAHTTANAGPHPLPCPMASRLSQLRARARAQARARARRPYAGAGDKNAPAMPPRRSAKHRAADPRFEAVVRSVTRGGLRLAPRRMSDPVRFPRARVGRPIEPGEGVWLDDASLFLPAEIVKLARVPKLVRSPEVRLTFAPACVAMREVKLAFTRACRAIPIMRLTSAPACFATAIMTLTRAPACFAHAVVRPTFA
jgi:hypothetical protein